MSASVLARLAALLAIPVLLPACILAFEECGTTLPATSPATCESAPVAGEWRASAPAADSQPAAKPPQETSGAPASAEAKARAKARKAEKRAHELELARMELDLAKLESERELQECKRKLDEARRELDESRRALEHFRTKLPRELADKQLDLDRSTQGKLEAEQELREMEATYAKDQFATDTKELVLMRHRRRVEFAARGLELAQAAFDDLKAVELPRREREHEKKLRDSEAEVREAEFALVRKELGQRLELARKRWAVSELERPDDDLEAKGD
ncbi:MAG: hypothetical protein FJ298_10350 [Planctomycetes bacterium]|nr:hypothetical protein [Planctomycetota bacterium]